MSRATRLAARGSHPAQQTQVDEAMAGALGEIDGLLTVKRQKEGLYLIGGKARIPAFWQTCGRVCCARVGGCERYLRVRTRERARVLARLVGRLVASMQDVQTVETKRTVRSLRIGFTHL